MSAGREKKKRVDQDVPGATGGQVSMCTSLSTVSSACMMVCCVAAVSQQLQRIKNVARRHSRYNKAFGGL
jgi:hypothetical protein